MSKVLNIGVLGCADIAKRHVIPTLRDMDEYRILGIASRTNSRADDFAQEFNTQPFYTYDALLEEKELDAVYIPLPNSLHYTWIKKSLNKNLHVIVEKPMACMFEEVQELNELAKQKNLVLMENFQFRFHSQLQFIKNMLYEGEIGELRSLRSSFGFPPFSNSDNIRYKKELGGGALLDVGVYPLKISQIFLGYDLDIDCVSLSMPNNAEVDIWGSACMRQKNSDLTSQIAFGFDHFYQNSIELWGSRGRIYTNRIFTAPPSLRPVIEIETSKGKEIVTLPDDNHFKNILSYFYALILNGDSVEYEYSQNINQSRLLSKLRLMA